MTTYYEGCETSRKQMTAFLTHLKKAEKEAIFLEYIAGYRELHIYDDLGYVGNPQAEKNSS